METITINDILYVIITIALPLVLRYGYQLVSAKLDGSKYEEAVDNVYTAVSYVNQTFVDSLKASGRFTAETADEAFAKAKYAALGIMKDSTYNWLEDTYTDVDEWLSIQIESAVKSSKVVSADGK